MSDIDKDDRTFKRERSVSEDRSRRRSDSEDRAFKRHSSSKPGIGEKIDRVCLDYQNSYCSYGNRCKFLHPNSDYKKESLSKNSLSFCEDYRRGSCFNSSCARVHANKLIEEEYRETGWLPRDIQQWVIEKYGLCLRFLTETCTHTADDCRYEHYNLGLYLKDVIMKRSGRNEFREDDVHSIVRSCGVCKEFTQGSCTRDPCKFLHSAPIDCGVGNSKTTWKDVWKREEGRHRDDGPDGKRRRMDDGRDFFTGMAPNNGSAGMGNYGMSAMGNGTTGMGGGGMMPNMAMANGTPEQQIWKLQNAVVELNNENIELKRKLEGMRSTNQFLLEENANIRMEMKDGRSRDSLTTRYSAMEDSRDRLRERGRDYGNTRFNDTGTTRY